MRLTTKLASLGLALLFACDRPATSGAVSTVIRVDTPAKTAPDTNTQHARAEMMEFNYFAEQGAITRDPSTGRCAIDFAKFPTAVASLAKELLTIEATGDRARAENWFNKYGTMPAELKAALDKTTSVPVDIDPITSFGETVK